MTSEERKAARYQRRKASREAKRNERLSQYDDFNQVIDVDNLYASFLKSKKGISWKVPVQRYEANAMRNILAVRNRLLAGENIHRGFIEFWLNERGKMRRIRGVHFDEQVVQDSLVQNVLSRILGNCLIYDNGASMKGKGTHFAIRRLIAHLSRFYKRNGNSNEGYALTVDFSKFFDSIDHAVLFGLLRRQITDERVLDLVYKFVSVFGPGKSLGLGSQVSQICSVFYPNTLDHYIKEKLRIKYYGRYMDDFYLIHADKEYLKRCLVEIKEVCAALKITLNERKTRIVKLSRGVEFLKGKYTLLENGRVLRRPVKGSAKRMRRKLKKFRAFMDEGKIGFEDLRGSYQSWRGNFKKRFNVYKQVGFMDMLYNRLFIFDRDTIGG
jgi:hypothetical protein